MIMLERNGTVIRNDPVHPWAMEPLLASLLLYGNKLIDYVRAIIFDQLSHVPSEHRLVEAELISSTPSQIWASERQS